MNTPAVLVQDLHKHYGDKHAVDGLDLRVEQGEIFAVLGPNGAGKTTTVEILEGYRKRDRGTVQVLGEDPQHAGRLWRSRIGIVLQSADDHAELTVSEMVRHHAAFYPGARDADEVIDAVGLADKARTRTRALSGGQRRRLDVALGIIGNPSLLFLDEPTTGFDPEARRSFWSLISSLREDGTTILLTTHDMMEAEKLCDRVAIIHKGKLIALDTPEALKQLAPRVNGQRPSLEDVFIHLTGDKLKDEQKDDPDAALAVAKALTEALDQKAEGAQPATGLD